MSPNFAEAGLIVQQAQFLYYVVHDQVYIDLGFVAHAFLVRLAQLADLTNVESLIRVQFKHAHHDAAKLRRVLFAQWRGLAFRYPLKQLVERQILFVTLSKRTSKLANLISDAAERPDIGLPVVAFALEDLGTHVERGSDARKRLESLTAKLPGQTQISHFQSAVIIDKDVRRLQISVHDSFLVHVLQRSCYLVNVFNDSLLLKVYFILHGLLDDQLKVALFGPFNGNEKFVELAVDEPAEILYDVWVI